VKVSGAILHFVSLLFFSLVFGKPWPAVYIVSFLLGRESAGVGRSPCFAVHAPSDDFSSCIFSFVSLLIFMFLIQGFRFYF
jgi:hypothetical protein